MFIIKMIAIILGLAFILFGYFIFFRKKYFLINNYEEDFQAGRKDESYAKRVGIIEFTLGIIILITALVLCCIF